MSLNWDLSKIKDRETLCWREVTLEGEGQQKPGKWLNPDTDMLIWGSMAIGIGELTEENAREWYLRLKLLERVGSAIGHKDGKPYTPPLETIKAHVGLRTNVGRTEPRKRWANRVMEVVIRDLDREIPK